MLEEFEKKRRKQTTNMRSMVDYIMGFLFFCIGLYFLLYRKLGVDVFNQKPSGLDYFIGVLFVVYGGWRMYRGYKKNYFKES